MIAHIMVLYDAFVKWIFNRSLWALIIAGVITAMLAVLGWFLKGQDYLQLLRDFTAYFKSSVESINAFAFVESHYHAFTGCHLEWNDGFMNICKGGGVNFFSSGIEAVTDQITYWTGIGSAEIWKPGGGGKGIFFLLPLYALAFVIGSLVALWQGTWAYFGETSILAIVLLMASLRLALFVTGAGSPAKAISGSLSFLFETQPHDNPWEKFWGFFWNFVVLLVNLLFLFIVAGMIAFALQWFLELAIVIFETTLGGLYAFCATCYGFYNFLKNADSLEELASGNVLGVKSNTTKS